MDSMFREDGFRANDWYCGLIIWPLSEIYVLGFGIEGEVQSVEFQYAGYCFYAFMIYV